MIGEWNVEFTKPAGMDDLRYVMLGTEGNTAAFDTGQLVNLDNATGGKYCVADEDPIGALARTHTLSSFDGQYIPTNVHVGNYYYWFNTPQAVCSDNKEVGTLESEQASELEATVLKTLEVAP